MPLVYRNQLEVAVRVNSLHGGLAQGKRLRSKVHDRVAVVGNSWDFGKARISFESLWKLLSSSPECLFTTSRCGWPVASIASLGCEQRKHKGDKFVPLSRQGRIFLSANRSQSRSPNRRWRYLQDRGASSMHSPYLDEEL